MQKTLVLGALMFAFGLTMAQQVTTYSVYDTNHNGEISVTDVTETVTQITNNVAAASTQQYVTAEDLSSILKNIQNDLILIKAKLGIESQDDPEPSESSNSINGHAYVDLGITDANGKTLYWATCNVGATNPEDYGYYFAWGATTGCDNTTGTCSDHSFNWANAPFNGGKSSYSSSAWSSAKSTAVDANNNLLPANDAATANWGGAWRMPTYAEQTKLRTECYWQWVTSYNGKTVNGYVVYKAKATADKGKYSYNNPSLSATYSVASDTHIFLPAAGFRYDSYLRFGGSNGYYLSSSLNESNPDDARYLSFGSGGVNAGEYRRYFGRSVRPVCVSSE